MDRRLCCLLIVYRLPWPPMAGGSLRDWQNIVALAARTELSVVALSGGATARPHATPVALWTSLDAELLREPAPFDGSEGVLEHDWWRNPLGFYTDDTWSPFRAAALRRLLRTQSFDFAVIEDVNFWRYAEIVREAGPVIIDYHNVQSRVEEEYLAFVGADDRAEREKTAIALRTMRHVEQMYRNVPAIVCSEAEKAALAERGFPPENVAVIHNTVDVGSGGEAPADPAVEPLGAPRVLFAGMMEYGPNVEAAHVLVGEIFPRVRSAVADAELWIVGMAPTPGLLRAVRGVAGIYVTGGVASTEPYFRSASVLSVPLTRGGGTRFKILEAFQYGLPVTTSPKGCEGLNVVDGRHLLIARSPAEHADAILAVLQDPVLAGRLAREGHALVREHYSFTTAAKQWDECLVRFGL
jgi:glycosyltransferase involved in cell wall biosynthesis